MGEPQTQKLHCNDCGRTTNHSVLHQESDRWSDDVDMGGGDIATISGGGTYSIVKCLGCDSVSYLTKTWFSEETGPDGLPCVNAKRYPAAMSRRHPEWFANPLMLPLNIREFLEEIYIALQNESLRLCALGIRALIEEIMVAKIGDTGALGTNIEAFFKAGFVAPHDQEQFRHKVVEVGNAAMHRGYTPVADDIHTLLDITEALVASIYVHPHRAAELGKDMPERGRKKLTC